MLASAATGAAKAVARKLLDTVVREALQWQRLREQASQAAGLAPLAGKSECHEAAHLCRKSDKDLRSW
jgi:hypothetical protein